MREDPQVHFSALNGLNFTLDDFFGSRKLFSSKSDTLTLDAKAPVSVCKCSSFGGSTNGDWNDALVSLDERYFSRCELMPQPH